MAMRAHLLLMLAAAAPLGCLHRDELPGLGAPPAEVGPPVSSYTIAAAGKETGAVHVVSLGSERLPAGPGKPDLYLHLRLAADNREDAIPWDLDPREQKLLRAGRVDLPAYAAASGGGPVLRVERGKRGVLDVYYPLQSPTGDPRVSLIWRLRRGVKTAGLVTHFLRAVSPDTAYIYYQPERGPQVVSGLRYDSWWWGDYYFWQHGELWWPCSRRSFYGHYPDYTGRGETYTRPMESPPAAQPAGLDWRGRAEAYTATDPVKSDWRGSSSSSSSSSSSGSSNEQGSGGGAPASGGGSSIGAGQSSWRGGSGP
jgi:uncharacterized membrane protein YgcG